MTPGSVPSTEHHSAPGSAAPQSQVPTLHSNGNTVTIKVDGKNVRVWQVTFHYEGCRYAQRSTPGRDELEHLRRHGLNTLWRVAHTYPQEHILRGCKVCGTATDLAATDGI